jgi:hypothetical protein
MYCTTEQISFTGLLGAEPPSTGGMKFGLDEIGPTNEGEVSGLTSARALAIPEIPHVAVSPKMMIKEMNPLLTLALP